MIATTIEQSKELIGLLAAKHDMFYDNDGKLRVGKPTNKGCIPAWSLTALLSLLPEKIDTTSNPKNLHLQKWYDDEFGAYYYSLYYIDYDGDVYYEVFDEEPINAVFEMVRTIGYSLNDKLELK